MVVLGLVAAGGVVLASKFAGARGEGGFGSGGGLGFGDDEEPEAMTKKETTTYAEPGVVKPPQLPSFKDIFNLPLPKTVENATQIPGSVSKKTVTPHPYAGGAVTSGAYTIAPWSTPTPTTPYQYYGGAVKPGAYTVAPWAGAKGGGSQSTRGSASSKSVQRARARVRHTAARKARMSKK